MVRSYCRKMNTRYTPKQLEAAVEVVKQGEVKLCQASKKYNIPPRIPLTTSGDHTKQGISRIGAGSLTILTKEEEKEIVEKCRVEEW